MSDPAKTFESLNIWTDGIEKMRAQVQGMRDVLAGLEARTLPDDAGYTPEDLQAYLVCLVERCQLTRVFFTEEPTCKGVLWRVPRFRRGMPEELRRELVLIPTALAAATLSRCVLQFPLLASTVPRIADVLSAALAYLASKFPGVRQVDARQELFDLLHQGWVPLLLWENPRLSPPMSRLLARAPHFDFHVEHARRRRYELFHALHVEDLRRLRDEEPQLEQGWFPGPAMEGDRVSPAGREAYSEEELAALMGFPAPKRLFTLKELRRSQAAGRVVSADEGEGGQGDLAFFLPARLVGRPMQVTTLAASVRTQEENDQ